MVGMLIPCLVMTLLQTASAITGKLTCLPVAIFHDAGSAELCSQVVNVTTSNTVVIVGVGNVSFVCNFEGDPVTSWLLNEQTLSGKNGTLDITTDELFGDSAVSYLQCTSDDLVYNITAVLVTSKLQVKLCNCHEWSNGRIEWTNRIKLCVYMSHQDAPSLQASS